MAYLQKSVEMHGFTEEQLAQKWDDLPSDTRRGFFREAAEEEDKEKEEMVVHMELGYLSEQCSWLTVQKMVTALTIW